MMRRTLSAVSAGILVAAGAWASPPERATAPPDRAGVALAAALAHADARDWFAAGRMAHIAGPVGSDIVTWHRLRNGNGGWSEYVDFMAHRSDWPGIARLHREGEGAVAAAAPAAEVIAYFEERPPLSGAGVIALIDAFEQTGATDRAAEEAMRAWQELAMSRDAEEALLARYASDLQPLHAARLDAMLWRGHHAAAERATALLGAGWNRLAEARMALAAREPGVDARVDAVPDSLADHPGLAHARFDWRMRAGFYDSAAELMAEHSRSADTLGRPAAWANDRIFLARRAMRDGDVSAAYARAAHHHLESGAAFASLEWLAGFIALRHRDDAQTALGHFRTLRAGVSTPISLGRAGYWEGRAHAALGDADAASEAYAFAAQYQTTFYGQLAAEEAGLAMDPALAGAGAPHDWRAAAFAGHPLLRAVRLLHGAGEDGQARWFLSQLAGEVAVSDLEALGDFALSLGDPTYGVAVGKAAAARGRDLPRAGYPLGDLAEMDLPVPAALTLAIARRESEFNPAARSPAGALGLMQVVPGTARMMADRLGESYMPARLTTDPRYNARLGAEYLKQLTEEFGPSVILVAAGYNAGPGRPRRWVQEMGDPRDPAVDPVDWIEHVPFSETRNYIMRVMESMTVYRARLAGQAVPLGVRDALIGGG